jgi:hypothetical protein
VLMNPTNHQMVSARSRNMRNRRPHLQRFTMDSRPDGTTRLPRPRHRFQFPAPSAAAPGTGFRAEVGTGVKRVVCGDNRRSLTTETQRSQSRKHRKYCVYVRGSPQTHLLRFAAKTLGVSQVISSNAFSVSSNAEDCTTTGSTRTTVHNGKKSDHWRLTLLSIGHLSTNPPNYDKAKGCGKNPTQM